MKKLLLIPLFSLLFSGCASVTYTKPNGEEFSYSRLGTQNLTNFKLVTNEHGITTLSFSKQEGGENVGEIVKNVTEVAMTAMKKVP